jgi:uncharacterized membrane protein
MSNKTRDQFQLERLALFSDAVFAIAITLLVIEVRLPELHYVTEQSLLQALANLVPRYAGFVVSFFVIGRFWIAHHRLFSHLVRCDDTLVMRNLLFLFTIAFMPFPTAIIGEYAETRVGIGFYSLWLIFVGWRNRRLVAYALRTPALQGPGEDKAALAVIIRQTWAPILIGALGFAFGMITPLLALIPLIGSPLILKLVTHWASKF